ncbi:MAG: ATP-binding cassette domain-containing protein [Candidatus Saccharibacteria bacterium]|nr:ATP-binding cassette domain-containing protein [Candidatus Saccharibacteria bacterium]
MLELKNITFEVKDSEKTRHILNDVSLKFKPGELVVLTGPNGSGKSTLAEIIMGIKKPKNGQIILNHEDITTKTITERAKLGISYAFQQPICFKGVTVRDLLEIAKPKNKDFKELEIVGLEKSEYLDREVNKTLSGGELKRIEIATVLARNSKIMIFDEPEAGIDIWSFDNLIKVFKKLKKENKDGIIIIISHQKPILEIADRVIILKKGSL